MKPSEIALMRLQNQQLSHTPFKKPQEIVSWLGAIQGQEYPGAKWAVGLRLHGSTDIDIEQSITEKAILRTWLMRGTLHLVTAEDIHWMLELLSPRIIKSNKRRYKELELDENTLKRSNKVLKGALSDANELNRRELLAILEQNGISTEGQRAAHMLQRASLEGIICQCGIYSNNNPIYMSLDLLPKTREPDEPLEELARRYFRSRSPATIQDFIWWSGLLAADARTGLEAIKSELKNESLNGQTYWYQEAESTVQDIAHLLPTYDEFLFAYRDRSASVNNISRIKLKNRYQSTIAINGQIVGTWKRTLQKENVIIEQQLFKKLNASENRALKEAKLFYGRFMNKKVNDLNK